MSEFYMPNIAPELVDLYDDHARQTHDPWRGHSMAQLRRSAPLGRPDYLDLPDGSQLSYVDIPAANADQDGAVLAVALPHEQGWKRSMDLRTRLARSIAVPGGRLMVFPQTTALRAAFSLTKEQRARVAAGDFEPVVDKYAFALDELVGEEETLHVNGSSLGATIMAGAAAKRGGVASLAAIEPPNAVRRTSKQLGKDFTKDTRDGEKVSQMTSQIEAIKDADIPAIEKTLGAPLHLRYRLLRDYGNFILGMPRSNNRALRAGMAHDRFYSDQLAPALAGNPGMATMLLNGEYSAIFPTVRNQEIAAQAEADGYQVDSITVTGYGHEFADSILNYALAAKRAVMASAARR